MEPEHRGQGRFFGPQGLFETFISDLRTQGIKYFRVATIPGTWKKMYTCLEAEYLKRGVHKESGKKAVYYMHTELLKK